MLCALRGIGDLDRRGSDRGCGLRRNQQNSLCGKDRPVSISGFGNGTVPAGALRNGTAPVRLDDPQTENTIAGRANAGSGVIVQDSAAVYTGP